MPATISVGSTGDDVKRLQRVLARQLIWNPFGPITGVFDATLETSVKTFQQSNGLAADGVVGPSTWAKLPAYREASPTLAFGSEGPAVAWLQQALAGKVVAVSFAPYAGAIDGQFGPMTEASVKVAAELGAGPGDRRRRRRELVRLADAGLGAAAHARSRLRALEQPVSQAAPAPFAPRGVETHRINMATRSSGSLVFNPVALRAAATARGDMPRGKFPGLGAA